MVELSFESTPVLLQRYQLILSEREMYREMKTEQRLLVCFLGIGNLQINSYLSADVGTEYRLEGVKGKMKNFIKMEVVS